MVPSDSDIPTIQEFWEFSLSRFKAQFCPFCNFLRVRFDRNLGCFFIDIWTTSHARMNQRERQEYGETAVYSGNYWVPGRSITRKLDTSLSQLQAISTYMSFDVRKSIKQIELSMHGWNPWFWIKRVVKYQIQLELLASTWGILHCS